MPILLQVRFQTADMGLLAVAFPQTSVLRGPPFPLFLASQRVIVVSDEEAFLHYPDREIIQVTRRAKLVLDSRPGFLRFLRECCGVNITPHQRDTLLNEYEMDDEHFWREAKLARFNRSFPRALATLESKANQRTTVVDIFDTLFEDYGQTYRRYRLSGVDYQRALYSLMTMMERTRKPEGLQRTSRRYRDILVKNRQFRRRYGRALLEYKDSLQSKSKHIGGEAEFLDFLYDCSTDEHLSESGCRAAR